MNFTEILTFLTGSTSLLYPERRTFADLPFLFTSGEPSSPPIYLSAGTGHEFSTRQFPHQTLQVCHNWAKVLSCQNEIQCWAIPDSYPLWSFDSVSIQSLRNFSSQSSKNPPALLTARVEVVSSQALRLTWQCRGDVPRCPSNLTRAVRSRNHFIFTDFLFSFRLSLFFPYSRNYWLLVFFVFFFLSLR